MSAGGRVEERKHPSPSEAAKIVRSKTAFELFRGKKILWGSFGVERTMRLLYLLILLFNVLIK